MRLVILLACCLFTCAIGEDEKQANRTETLINAIFVKPSDPASEVSTPINALAQSSSPSDADCECVPYYLCKDSVVIEDGVGIIDIRIEKTCKFLEHCCGAVNKTTESVLPKPKPHTAGRCGIRNSDGIGFRVTGTEDNETQFGEFPWMVALLQIRTNKKNLEKTESYQCGASLIHPQVVLTAAHCVSNRDDSYKIRAGEWDTHTTYELIAHQDRDIKQIVIHPQYYKGGLFYDFALLILDSPLELTDNVDVVCLPNKTVNTDNVFCYATGWGQEVFSAEGTNPAILKKVELPTVNRDLCQERLRKTRLGSRFKLHDTFMCAGGELGKDTCKGDGGSPLVCPLGDQIDKFYQAGIVSWGVECGKENIPGVYAHVAKAMDWIDNVMKTHNFDTSVYRY